MTQIFISYSRTDEPFARQLATALSDMGADIWIDIEDIPAGMKWSSAIQQGLDTADALIVAISPESMASRNVEDEWQYFLDHNKPVIPVFLRDAKIHFQLNRIQWIDFKNQPFDAALIALHAEMRRNGIKLQAPPAPTGDSPPLTHGHDAPPQPKPAGKNRTLLYGGAVIGFIIIIAIIAVALMQSNTDNTTQLTADAQSTNIAQLANVTQTLDTTINSQATRIAEQEATQAANFVNQTQTQTAQQVLDATSTARALPTATDIQTQINTGPISNNEDWQPIEQTIDGVVMVLVPSGRFTFGATQLQLDDNYHVCEAKLNASSCNALLDERNDILITFNEPFWIDKYEVSQRQYGSSNSQLPQGNVTSEQAQSYCETRNASLPTESEWEYAAKGPSNWRYPWGDSWDFNDVRANICDANCSNNWRELNYSDGYAEAAPVNEIHGSASWVGAFNMVGNVWEWTSDVYSDDTTNTLRGGAWTWIQGEATTTSRAAGIADQSSFYGFRCIRPYQASDLSQ